MSAGASRSGHEVCGRCRGPLLPETGQCAVCGALSSAFPCALHGDRLATVACVVCGRAVCSECRRGTRHAALCPEHAAVSVVAGWAELTRTPDEVGATLLAARLRSGGIEARILSQKDRANVVTFGGLSVVRVLVPAHRLEEARETLEEDGGAPARLTGRP